MAENEETIILLMKDMEGQFFSDYIKRFNQGAKVIVISSKSDLLATVSDPMPNTRLIAFSTNIIVPKQTLDYLNHNCVNFHPGSPEFPGYRPTGFALYENSRTYGVTAHYMTEIVDSGPIIGVERFLIDESMYLIDVVKESYQRLARLLIRLLPRLARVSEPIASIPEQWSGETRTFTRYNEMRLIPADMAEEEIAKRFRCFDGIYTALPDPRCRYVPKNS